MKRRYQQHCGVARALDVVGERWTLLIVRNLLLGPRRYGTLLEELPGLTTNLLAQRLHELSGHGLAEQVETRDATLWSLTVAGRQLEPVIMELGRFGGRYMDKPRRGDRLDLGWALLSLKRRYVPGTLEGRVVGILASGREFELAGHGPSLSVFERPCAHAAIRVRGEAASVRAWLFGASAEGIHFEGTTAAELRRAFS